MKTKMHTDSYPLAHVAHISINRTEHKGLQGVTENEKQQMTLQSVEVQLRGKGKNSSLLH